MADNLEEIIEIKKERLKKIQIKEMVLSRHNLSYPVDLDIQEQVYYLRLGIFYYQEDVKHYAEIYKENK